MGKWVLDWVPFDSDQGFGKIGLKFQVVFTMVQVRMAEQKSTVFFIKQRFFILPFTPAPS